MPAHHWATGHGRRSPTSEAAPTSERSERAPTSELYINNILRKRRVALQNLEVQANKMKKQSDAKFSPVAVGKTVLVPISAVDRSRTDSRNVTAVVLEEKDGFYKLGTTEGVFRCLYTRSQFTPCSSDLVPLESVPSTETSLRQIVSSASVSGGQGMQKSDCRQKCTTKRCSCRARNVLCNSRCHNSQSCTNKYLGESLLSSHLFFILTVPDNPWASLSVPGHGCLTLSIPIFARPFKALLGHRRQCPGIDDDAQASWAPSSVTGR